MKYLNGVDLNKLIRTLLCDLVFEMTTYIASNRFFVTILTVLILIYKLSKIKNLKTQL